MVPKMEKPRVTEINVRMDCKGCVLKIKKALNGISGIHDIQVDFPQQKITIIGWADPENLVKAIKKARKNALIISVHTQQCDNQPPPPKEHPELEKPTTRQSDHQDYKSEVHVIHDHNPPDYPEYGYGYGGRGDPPRPGYVTHSYNAYKPSPYVTEYAYTRSPPRYSFNSRTESFTQDYHHNFGNSNITSMFSEENPNACTIV